MFGNPYFGDPYFGDVYFGPTGQIPPVQVVPIDGSGLIITRRGRRKIKPPERARLAEDIIREQRMVAEYLDSLEQKPPQAKLREPSIQDRGASTGPAAIPRLTDAMARAASVEQLIAIMRSASAAEFDRQRAVEEEHRRQRRTLLLLLALD